MKALISPEKPKWTVLRRRACAIACLFWMAFISLSSTQVIAPHTYFQWLHENLFRNDSLFRGFQVFWSYTRLFFIKGWHLTEFAILMLLVTWFINAVTAEKYGRNLLIAAIICIGFAASDELHQSYVPYRGGSFSDILFDASGVVLAAAWQLRRHRGNNVRQLASSEHK